MKKVYLKKGDVINADCLLEVQEDGTVSLLEVLDTSIYNDDKGCDCNVEYDLEKKRYYYEEDEQ